MKGINTYKVTGLMSGTSLDGTDLALAEFTETGREWSFRLVVAETVPYPEELNQRLRAALNMESAELFRLNFDLGNYYGRILNSFHEKTGILPDFISSHGHTVFHRPDLGYTFQAGSGEQIALLTNRPVVCDFRTRDVLLGGQGAPLVPIGDELLFSRYEYCLNLGGIANISYRKEGKRIACDLVPVNMALNFLAELAGMSFDRDGKLAAEGRIDGVLLKRLNDLDFYRISGPRSLGAEWFRSQFLPLISDERISLADRLATVSEHIAEQISKELDLYPSGKMLVTGGGAYNENLIRILGNKTGVSLVIPAKELVEFKEALVFAFLGLLRWRNEINCLSSVTGARSDSSTGIIFKPQ
ncbi:MAG: anhydro-N-acetylmuramic acid kinase [Bacteroidota bacterium]